MHYYALTSACSHAPSEGVSTGGGDQLARSGQAYVAASPMEALDRQDPMLSWPGMGHTPRPTSLPPPWKPLTSKRTRLIIRTCVVLEALQAGPWATGSRLLAAHC
eukprot:358888-Chlamydomonas_euryale.AAC.1